MGKNLTYTIEQKGTSFIVIDSLECVCGIYDTEANAALAIPKINANVNRGYVHSWLLKPVWKQNRQVSNKTSTARYNKKGRNK